MARLIFSAMCSLDGYTADASGDFGWAMPDEEVLTSINDEARTIGTYLLGRRMYQMLECWETDPTMADTPESAEFAKVWTAADKVVYSSTLTEVVTSRTRLEPSFDPAAVRKLLQDSTADIAIDGPTLAAHALRSGLVDRLHLIVCPVVVGGGLSMLPPDVHLDLRLDTEHRFGNGMVHLGYDVQG